MNTLAPILLDGNWEVEYFEVEPNLYEWGPAIQPVPSLMAWHCEGRFDEGWAACLQTRFDLAPFDFCIRYDLHVEDAPGMIILYINGRRMGEVAPGAPFVFDVTDWVTLEDNRLTLRVTCGAAGKFGRVYLQPHPCE